LQIRKISIQHNTIILQQYFKKYIIIILSCVHISVSSHNIEHYIHYYIIIVRLCACHVTWLDL